MCIIGLGLFAFIAEEAFRSCEATKNQQRQQIGEVLGNKINVQEFQALVDEYQDVLKMTQESITSPRSSSTASRTKCGTHSSTSRSSRLRPQRLV